MKKKLLFLAFGVLGLFASVNAQTIASGPGTLAPNGFVGLNTVISFNGQLFMVIPIPDTQIDDFVSEQNEQNLTIALINQGVVVDLPGSTPGNSTTGVYGNEATRNGDAYFGFDINNYTLQVIPFDFGLSAVLGAGALGAVRAARKRRKENAVA